MFKSYYFQKKRVFDKQYMALPLKMVKTKHLPRAKVVQFEYVFCIYTLKSAPRITVIYWSSYHIAGDIDSAKGIIRSLDNTGRHWWIIMTDTHLEQTCHFRRMVDVRRDSQQSGWFFFGDNIDVHR